MGDSRRRELRREHATLEELRQQWRLDAQQVRATGSGGAHALLNDVRGALDERAAALNKSVDEFRALERALSARRNSSRVGASGALPGRGNSPKLLSPGLLSARGDTGGASTPRPGLSSGVGLSY